MSTQTFLLSYSKALDKMIQIIETLNDGSMETKEVREMAAGMLPNSRLFQYIGNPSDVPDDLKRVTSLPTGYIAGLIEMSDDALANKLVRVKVMIGRLKAFMTVLKSCAPLVDAIELYNRLYLSNSDFEKMVMDVIMNRLPLPQQQTAWLFSTLSDMLFGNVERTDAQSKLIQMMVSCDQLPREANSLKTILDVASELRPDGSLHTEWYPQFGSQSSEINLLQWVLDLIERNDSVLEDIEFIAKECGFKVTTWPEYDEFITAIKATDWDMIIFLIINEVQAYSSNGEVISLMLSRAK